jgi:hypothetical protein
MLLLLIFLISFSALSQVDVVIDIDWTLVSQVDSYDSNNSRVYKSLGDYYRLTDGASEIIEDLIENESVRISFYSGGSEARNLDLLDQIKLSNGKSLLESSYKVLSRKHLLEVSRGPDLKFAERYKKDLTLINNDLKSIILIDDIKNFTPPNQRKNVLWVGKTFVFQDTFSQVNAEHYAKTEIAWLRDRYKLYSSHSKITNALEMMKIKDISFVDAVKKSRSFPLKSAYRISKKFNILNKIKSGSDCYLFFGF